MVDGIIADAEQTNLMTFATFFRTNDGPVNADIFGPLTTRKRCQKRPLFHASCIVQRKPFPQEPPCVPVTVDSTGQPACLHLKLNGGNYARQLETQKVPRLLHAVEKHFVRRAAISTLTLTLADHH
jgi:hypothetical protein